MKEFTKAVVLIAKWLAIAVVVAAAVKTMFAFDVVREIGLR